VLSAADGEQGRCLSVKINECCPHSLDGILIAVMFGGVCVKPWCWGNWEEANGESESRAELQNIPLQAGNLYCLHHTEEEKAWCLVRYL